MITKITKKQEKLIPEYVDKWIQLASHPIDRSKIRDIFRKIYNEDKVVIIGESLENTINLIKFAKTGKTIKCDSQLYSQLRSQLHSQLRSQLYSQLDSQLRSQLNSQLRSQLRSQLNSQLFLQLYSQLNSRLDSVTINYSSYVSYYLYNWAGYYDYANLIGVEFDKNQLSQYFEILLNIPIVVFVGSVIFVCEKPKCIWENKTLHSETKPAIFWEDGTGIYFLNGIKFEKDLWEEIVSKKINTEKAIKLQNAEQRIIALKYIGGEKLQKDLGGVLKAKDEYGELIELTELKDTMNRNYVYYKAIDPSKNEYVYLRCHPDCETPKEAMTQSYKLQIWGLDYKPGQRT